MEDTAAHDQLALTVRDRPEEGRYEATTEGRLAGIAAYRLRPGAVAFTHTEVLPEWEGRGVGGRLARGALDDVRARGLAAIPICPFIAAWIRRHPDYADLVPAGERHRIGRRDG
jgi:predicted GNAT family acetyltransferase